MNIRTALRLTCLVLLAGVVSAILWLLPTSEWLGWLVARVQAMGLWGPVCLAVAYIIATVLFVPGSLLTLGAGFAFGVARGTIAVSVGSTLGASAAWFLGRTIARGFVAQRVANNPKFRALDQAIGEQGFKIVLLLRLSPVFPYILLNYALGLTRVSFRDFVIASWLGMLPATVLFVYLGSSVRSLADLAAGNFEGGPGQKTLFMLGLMATVGVTVLITRAAKRALQDVLPSGEPGPNPPP